MARRHRSPSKCAHASSTHGAAKRKTLPSGAVPASARTSGVTWSGSARWWTNASPSISRTTPNTTLPGISGRALGHFRSSPRTTTLLLLSLADCLEGLGVADDETDPDRPWANVARPAAGLGRLGRRLHGCADRRRRR